MAAWDGAGDELAGEVELMGGRGYSCASLIQRAKAGLLDWIIVPVLGLECVWLLNGHREFTPMSGVAAAVAVWLNTALWQGRWGWTLGKRVFHLRTVLMVRSAAGRDVWRAPGVLRCTVRWCIHLADIVPLLAGLWLVPMSDPKWRTGADMLTGTVVLERVGWRLGRRRTYEWSVFDLAAPWRRIGSESRGDRAEGGSADGSGSFVDRPSLFETQPESEPFVPPPTYQGLRILRGLDDE